ncbi:hypothetical protein [Microbispora rosea]|uniref:hypothetical protein n=1 Tax=Microbispora rosea TaxID=58117 RepID=UPI003D941632
MSGEGYRVLLRARARSSELRAKGFTWDQIADVLALDNDVSPLRLYRLAHGRTAAEVVSLVNDLDPAGTASLREARLYDFEAWPDGGRRPPVRCLVTLARVYQTHAARLVTDEARMSYSVRDRELLDATDLRDLDENRSPGPCPDGGRRVSMEASAGAPLAESAVDTSACVELLRAIGIEEADVRRRELLFELALAFGGTQALRLLRVLDAEEEQRLGQVVRSASRVDPQTVATFEKLTAYAREVDDGHGPAALLPAVNGQRNALAQILARDSMPQALRSRLLAAYGQLSQLAGYLAYDLLDVAAAQRALNEGLRAALNLGDPTLIGYLHCWLGSMAAYQQRAALALDHAFAARGWVTRSPSRLLRAMNESVLSAAYAAAGDATASARAHDNALRLAGDPKGEGEPAFLYWISPSMLDSKAAMSLVRLRQAGAAVAAAQRTLAGLDPRFKVDRGFALAQYATALTLAREIPEATARLSEAADIAAQHTSARLAHQIAQARAGLQPWSGSTHVTRLDKTLQARGLSGM